MLVEQAVHKAEATLQSEQNNFYAIFFGELKDEEEWERQLSAQGKIVKNANENLTSLEGQQEEAASRLEDARGDILKIDTNFAGNLTTLVNQYLVGISRLVEMNPLSKIDDDGSPDPVQAISDEKAKEAETEGT